MGVLGRNRTEARGQLVGIVMAALVGVSSSWETTEYLLAVIVQRDGPGDYMRELVVAIVVALKFFVISLVRPSSINIRQPALIMLAIVFGGAVLSVGWAWFPTYAATELVLLLTTVGAYVALVSRFGACSTLVGLVVSGQVIVLLALLSSEFPFSVGGHMVYPGKLSPVVQVSICVVAGFMVSSRPRKTLKNLLLWGTGIVLLVLDFLAMIALDNRTGQLAMGLTAACASTFALNQLLERRKSRIWNCRRVTTWAPLALLTVSVALIRYTPTSLLGRNIDPTFTGRKTLWEATWQGILDRPLFGWGWLSGWFDPLFRDTVLPEVGGRAPRFYWSHSVWLDIGLSLGLPGLILAMSLIIVALSGPIRADLRSHVTTSIMLTTLPIHLMFTSLHREAQYAFAVVVLAVLIRSGALSNWSNTEEKPQKAIS